MTSRRNFIKTTGLGMIAGVIPSSLVELSFAGDGEDFTFAYISDAHIQHIRGNQFVRSWDEGLIRAVTETNSLKPEPDFVVFGGDLAQLGSRPELDHGAEILSGLNYRTHMVMGEHDYYLDLGDYWRELFGPEHYSFDHKGVHFVVLNSILTHDDWTFNRWSTAQRRMLEMAGLDNPNGSPFMVGETQRLWLKQDLDKVGRDTPIVVLSHSPLQKIHRAWNFWTDDAEQVQEILRPFRKVNVIYGHVHQIQYNQVGNIAFNSMMATAWPWPYPGSYSMENSHLPVMTVPMTRDDPFNEREGTGWQLMNVHSGRADIHYRFHSRNDRAVVFDHRSNQPVDTGYQKRVKVTV
jgi:3',5'-cyclic AMP phosphodiesterase CpdA